MITSFHLQVNVSTAAVDSSRAYHGWFQLSPRPRESQPALPEMDLGSIRMSVRYSQNFIYHLDVYGPLQSLLMQSLEAEVSGGEGRLSSVIWYVSYCHILYPILPIAQPQHGQWVWLVGVASIVLHVLNCSGIGCASGHHGLRTLHPQ